MNRIYLLLGPEEGDKKDKLEEIRRAIFAFDPDMEEESYYAGDDSASQILQTLRQPSLFSSTRLITINHLELVKKDSPLIKGLKEYVKDAEDDVFLIMISSDSTSFFTAAEEKNLEKSIFYEEFERDKINWIRTTFKKQLFAVTEDAIEEILSSVENNKAEMRALIELLCSYYRNRDENKKVIDGDDVATVITREKGENGYTLFKAVAKRDLEEALMIIKSIALNDPSRLISTLSTLTVEFKTTENAIALKERGLSEKEIQKEAKGIATSFQTKGFNFRRKEGIYLCMKNYTKEDIKRIIIYLVNADTELKKAGSDAEDLFEDLIYNIIVNSARKRREDIFSRLEVKLV